MYYYFSIEKNFRMYQIAVLLTVYNRKDKTIRCLSRLFEQQDASRFSLSVFVVDGGSSDGTTDSIRFLFPSIHLSVYIGREVCTLPGMRL